MKNIKFTKIALDNKIFKHLAGFGRKKKNNKSIVDDKLRCDRCNIVFEDHAWLVEIGDNKKNEAPWSVVCDVCKNKYVEKFKYLKLFSDIEVIENGKD